MNFCVRESNLSRYAGLAELADALALGASGRKAVQVQVLCPAPHFRSEKKLGFTRHLYVILFLAINSAVAFFATSSR